MTVPVLYAFGDNPLYYFSQSGIAASAGADPNQFVPLTNTPFDVHSSCTGAARNTLPQTPTWIVVSNTGQLAYSTDLSMPWTKYHITYGAQNEQQLINVRRLIVHLGLYILVGARKDPVTLNEYAVIYTTATGDATNSWYKAYESADPHSMIMDVTAVGTTNTLVAVGYQNGIKNPLAILSPDLGQTWNNIPLDPTVFSSAVYSVAVGGDFNPPNNPTTVTTNIYFGGNGWISIYEQKLFVNTQSTTEKFYLLSDQFKVNNQAKPIRRIAANNTYAAGLIKTHNLIALQGDTVHYSNNLFDWQSLQQPGYHFVSAFYDTTYADGTWYLGTQSMLNQYNMFTLAAEDSQPIADDAQLLPHNIGIQAAEFILA